MTTPTFPDIIRPSQVDWRFISNTASHSSPFSRSVQTQEYPGARWAANLRYKNLGREDVQAFEAFLVSLRGSSGRFFLWNHAREEPLGSNLGSPVVANNPDPQTGTTLRTEGWAVSETGLLLPGDYFTAGAELKMVMESVDSDGSGIANIVFEPPLRGSPTDGGSIITSKPYAIFKLMDDGQTKFNYEKISTDLSFEVIEAFL